MVKLRFDAIVINNIAHFAYLNSTGWNTSRNQKPLLLGIPPSTITKRQEEKEKGGMHTGVAAHFFSQHGDLIWNENRTNTDHKRYSNHSNRGCRVNISVTAIQSVQ